MKYAEIFKAPNNDGTGRSDFHVSITDDETGDSAVYGGFKTIGSARTTAKIHKAFIISEKLNRNPAPKPKRGRPKNTPERKRKKALKAKLDELYNSPTIRFRSLEKAKARLLNRNPSPKWRIAGVTDGGGVYWFTGTKFTTEIRQAKAFASRTAAKAEAVSLKQQLPNQIAYLRIQ